MNALVLVSDAFGGRGGIALYNRHLLRALCEFPGMERVIAIPRVMTYAPEEMPRNLEYKTAALGGKVRYALLSLITVFRAPRINLLICSHINLLPIAYVLRLILRCKMVLIIYGIEAWNPSPHRIANYLCRKLEAFIAIRKLTAKSFTAWANLGHARFYYLPNCIDDSQYGIAPRRPDLEERYGTRGKAVIITAGRLDTSSLERNKGFDEILEVLPILRNRVPSLVYLIMGDGDDKERLVHKAEELGVSDLVVFTGYVPEREKADHYRLADVFAMPGSNPMFDRYPFRFVFLEALACGVPVVGCRLENSEEQEDPGSRLIIQVDPTSKSEIAEGILRALLRPKGRVEGGLETYFFSGFKARLHDIVADIQGGRLGGLG
jgi:phosphatidylinositol alpha-1,6-mannosyltransferase